MAGIYSEGIHGVGDIVIQHCFIKQLTRKGHEAWLKTPLAEIYQDIRSLYCVKTGFRLRPRGEMKNNPQIKFESVPVDVPCRCIFYGDTDPKQGGIFTTIECQTERREWHNASRGPLDKSVDSFAGLLADRGWHVASVAGTEPGQKWIPDSEPFAHQKLHHGELSIAQITGSYAFFLRNNQTVRVPRR